MITLLLYLLLGAFAGTMAGLLGVGGGLIMVPVLVFIFAQQGMSPEVIVHLAIGSSLATIVFTSMSSVRAHHAHRAVLWPVFWRLTPGILLGAWVGALIADALPADALRRVFAIFELAIAAQLAFAGKPAPHRTLPGTPGMLGVGGVIGALSAIIGIGGGSLTVPFLVWCNINVRNAVATSAACGFPIALAGSAGFIWAGWGETGLPAFASGYIYWPAVGGIVLTSMAFAPLGARLAHRLPTATLKRFFALFLATLGIKMLFG